MSQLLNNVLVVLMETTHSGNIGSVARAMKNMGLSRLILVNPQCEIDGQAIALASGAQDVLANAQSVETLTDAIKDCQWVVGTSARQRRLNIPLLNAREAATQAMHLLKAAPASQNKSEPQIALVFGRERNGLTTDELGLCTAHVYINTNPDYPSLNLAQAVQVLSYELRMAEDMNIEHPKESSDSLPNGVMMARRSQMQYRAKHSALEGFFVHGETVLKRTPFFQSRHSRKLMLRIRRLFNRADISEEEVHILRGMLTALNRSITNAPQNEALTRDAAVEN